MLINDDSCAILVISPAIYEVSVPRFSEEVDSFTSEFRTMLTSLNTAFPVSELFPTSACTNE